MSRLVLTMATAKKRHVPPYSSLDGPFCPHWRMCCNVNGKGGSRVC